MAINVDTVLAAVGVGGRAVAQTKEFFDQFGYIADDVSVTVWGTPDSTKAELHRMAASLAFSLARRLGPSGDLTSAFHPAPGAVSVTYDAAQKWVTFTVKYNNSLMVVLASAAFLPKKVRAGPLSRLLPVLGGPKDEHLGETWTFRGPGIGAPAPFVLLPPLLVPDLERWEGKVILTDQDRSTPPVPGGAGVVGAGAEGATMNPRPAADRRGRADFANLVFTALSTPATDFDLLFNAPDGTPLPDGRTDFSGG